MLGKLFPKLVKYGLGIFLIYGVFYVGSRLEFEDPFKPSPIFKAHHDRNLMSEVGLQKDPLSAVSMTREAAGSLYRTFEKLVKIMDTHEIDYWLCCGTLLGAVRHKGVIPFDDDVDLFINERDGDKVLALKGVFNSQGLGIYQDRTSIKVYKLDGYHVRPKRKSFKLLPGVWFVRRKVERFPFIDLYISKVENGNYLHANHRAYRVFAKEIFKKEDVYPLKAYQFGPLKVKGPNNPKTHLDSTYGKEWDKYLVYSGNHSFGSDIKFKLPIDDKQVSQRCWMYGARNYNAQEK